MAELCLAAFGAIEGAKALFKPIIRQICYVFKSQSYIDELKKQVQELGDKREMVQQPVNHARRQGDEIYGGVTNWLNRVDEFTQKVAKPIIDDEDGAKKSCFKGLCPNLLSRYKLSKRAAKAAEDAPKLKGKGNFSKVFYRPPPESSVLRDVKDYEVFDSRKKVFQDVVEALKDDKLNIIGVYGMGGVGKTTLVKQVAKQVMEDKLFDKVVMAEVTQTPARKKIQDKLAFDLGMEFRLDENEFQRAERLRERLKKEKRLLIILDNIWTELELDAVGIPSGDVDKEREDDQRRRTIILTSREHDLLEKHMNSPRNFKINVLSKTEALQLFEKIVGDSTKISDVQSIADEIVERCGGLPVALITLAKALKNERLETWEYVLHQLSRFDAKEIDGMERNVFVSIKLSYDLLGSKEAKPLFLLCGLFSEGHAIPIPSLLRYGMGMGYFKNIYTLEEARKKVRQLIDKLKSSCLLLDGDAEDEVKMHDVIRVVAVSIAEEELMFNIPNVANVKKKMEETMQESPIAISLPYRDIEVLPERLQCPRLQLFLLVAKFGRRSFQIPDPLFEGTEELKVLSLTGIRFSSLPSSLGHLANLQTLCLHWCQLEDVAVVGQLNKLEILSLRYSEIKQLPHEIGQLTQLQLLDLSDCRWLEVIAPNVISKLSRLEELYMDNSFSQWKKFEGGSNASLVELKRLSKLTTLQIHVRNADILPLDLVNCWTELQSYRIRIGELQGPWSFKSETSRLMKLRWSVEQKFSVLLENYGTKILLKKAEDLHLEELKGVQQVVHELDDGEGFPQLKHLRVGHCHEILHIVGSVERVRCNKVFPLLESLSLYKLINLETICDRQLTEDQSFSNLRIIQVESCENLKHLFSFSMAKNLLRLQKIEVGFCDKLEMIVGTDMEKPTTSEGSKEIIAEDDPNQKVIFPSLEELSIKNMHKLGKIWHHQLASESFCKLKKLLIENCNDIMNIFPPWVGIPSSLVNLRVWGCKKIEEIIGHGGEEVKENRIVFKELKHLELYDLPRLTSFCSENFTLKFPSLERVSITRCPNMKTFSQGNLSTPKLDKVQVIKKKKCKSCHRKVNELCSREVNELCHWEGDLNSTMQKYYEEMVGFRYLKNLELSHFPRLREIWHGRALPVRFFSNLRELVVDDCMNMSSAIPTNLLRCLDNLRHLLVSNCDSLEEVLHFEEPISADEEHVGQPFPTLSDLTLIDLPKLKRFCNFTENIIELPKLDSLTIENCPNMETFVSNSTSVLQMSADNKEPHQKITSEENFLLADYITPLLDDKVAFPKLGRLVISENSKLQKLLLSSWHLKNLWSLEVSKCQGLINLLTLSTSESLVNLETIKISDCKMVEEIIQSHIGEEAKDYIVFRKLKYLGLDCLPSLTSFCSSNYALQFPSLEQVLVGQCPKMKIFSQGVVDTPKLNKVKLTEVEDSDEEDDDEGYWEGNLNDTIQKLFNEMHSKDKIEPTFQIQ